MWVARMTFVEKGRGRVSMDRFLEDVWWQGNLFLLTDIGDGGSHSDFDTGVAFLGELALEEFV